MRSLDPQEVKLAFGAFTLATVAGIAIPAYILGTDKITKAGKHSIAVAPDAALLGGVIIVLCILGFLTLWKRKRTFVSFALFLIGFAFTLFIGLIGFVFILARRLAHAARLEDQPLRDHGRKAHPLGSRQPAPGQGGRVGVERLDHEQGQGVVTTGRPQTPDREQALHPEGASSEEDPETHPVVAVRPR